MNAAVAEHLYPTILEEHRAIGDQRTRMIRGQALIYGALAIAFAWLYANGPKYQFLAPLFAAIFTALAWNLDHRIRHGLQAIRNAGEAIECILDPGESRLFFLQLAKIGSNDKDIRFGRWIDGVNSLLLLFFGGTAVALTVSQLSGRAG